MRALRRVAARVRMVGPQYGKSRDGDIDNVRFSACVGRRRLFLAVKGAETPAMAIGIAGSKGLNVLPPSLR